MSVDQLSQNKDPRDVIIRPIVSEKSYNLIDQGKYTFEVDPRANKTEIKLAIEKIFDVKVASVNTMNRNGKNPPDSFRYGQAQGHQARRGDTVQWIHRHLYGSRLRRSREMAIRKYKPTTPGRRGSSVADFQEVTRSTPEKSLVRPLPKTGGRNNQGRITTRHIGGGHKRQYRVIDFRRNDKDGVNAKVAHIEYDPNRTARIALLHFVDGTKRYILAPDKLKQGDIVESGPAADIKPGNNLPLRNIPVGTVVHAIELRPGGGAKMARSAGAAVRLVAKDGPLRPASFALW